MREIEIQKTNRIFATKNLSRGSIYKLKIQDDEIVRRDKLANAPKHCEIDNDNKMNISEIDKAFYINVALKRINDFKGEKEMARPKKNDLEKTEEPRLDEMIEIDLKEKDNMENNVNAQQTGVTMSDRARLLQKVMKLQHFFDEYKFVVDGYNDAQKYKYIRAGQYKVALRKGCMETGLLFKVNIANRLFQTLEKHEKTVTSDKTIETISNKMNLVTIQGSIVLTDVETGEETSYFCMADGADTLDKGIYKAETMLIKAFITMNFLINDGDEDYEGNTKETTKSNFTPDTKRVEITTQTVAERKMASLEYLKSISNMMHQIRQIIPNYGQAHFDRILKCIANNTSDIPMEFAVQLFGKVEERLSEIQVQANTVTDLGEL